MSAAAPLSLGTTPDGEPLTVDLDALIGSHTCIAANSGGGKSGAIRKLLETSYGKVPHLILDPEDEFYTLREQYSYVIAGGDGGDVPATVANAPALARMALANSVSLVAQVNDLGEDAAEFIAAFCDALIDAPRALWRPLLVVIDEAQRFAPSKGAGAAAAAVKNLLQRGRKRGYTAIVASTRVSELDAGVRGLCRNWMLGFVGQSLDRRTAADQLGFPQGSAEAKGLQTLEPRQFWGFGPALARQPVLFRVDDVDTTIVRSGQAKVPTPPAPEALREILAALAAPAVSLPNDEAAAPVENEQELQARIADLEAELAREQCVRRALHRQRDLFIYNNQRIRGLAFVSAAELDAIGPTPPVVDDRLTEAERDRQYGQPIAGRSETAPATQDAGVEAAPAAGPVVQPTAGAADRSLGAERKPLAVLAGFAPAGLTDAQWATIAGFKRSGGTWTTYRSRLRTAGLIEQVDGRWRSTAAGVAAVGGEVAEVPAPGPALVAFWAERVPGAGRMLKRLSQLYPKALKRDALAADLNMAGGGGTFGTYLSRLRGNGLLEEKAGRIRLAPALMGEEL